MSTVDVDEKNRAFAGNKMAIPQAELTKRRIRSVTWCLMCHTTAFACLQAALLLNPLHPLVWLSSTVSRVLSLKFLATTVEICVLTVVQVVLISQSLAETASVVRLSKANQLFKDPNWKKKNSALSLASKFAKAVVAVASEVPVKALTGRNLNLLLSNLVTTLMVGLLFVDPSSTPLMLMAGTFVSLTTRYGLRPMDGPPVVNLPLLTQVKTTFKDTARTLFMPCLRSFLGLNLLIFCYQIFRTFGSQEFDLLSVFSHLNLSTLIQTFSVYYFLVLMLKVNNRVTQVVFLTNWHFPVDDSEEGAELSLLKALESTKELQLVASRDLVFVSELDPERRAKFWVLSTPGGHPYRFNKLMQIFSGAVLRFQEDFDLKKEEPKATTTTIKSPFSPSFGTPPHSSTPNPMSTPAQPVLARFKGLLYQTPQTPTIRPMESVQSPLRLVATSGPPQVATPARTTFEKALKSARDLLSKESPDESRMVAAVMAEAPFLAFLSSALANLAQASITEDKYGIVHLKLKEIVSDLITLLHAVERRATLNLNSKVDLAEVNRAVDLVQDSASRALRRITKTFGESLFDLKWSDKERDTLVLYI